MGRLGLKINKNVFAKGAENYANNASEFPENVELEPGRYVCIVEKANAREVKGTNKLILDLKVTGETDKAGGRISLWYDIDDPEKIVWLYKDLGKLGYDIDDMDEDKLADTIDQIEQDRKVVRITAKRKGEYVNYFLDKVLEELTAAEAEGSSEEPVESEGSAADEDAAPKAGLKKGKAKAQEAEEEAEEEEVEEPEDDLAELDRAALKKLITTEKLDVKVVKSMDDDAIREAIKEARSASEPAGEEPEPEAEEPEAEQVELKVGDKVTATIRGKKVKGCTVKSIDEENAKVKVQLPDKTLATVAADLLEV